MQYFKVTLLVSIDNLATVLQVVTDTNGVSVTAVEPSATVSKRKKITRHHAQDTSKEILIAYLRKTKQPGAPVLLSEFVILLKNNGFNPKGASPRASEMIEQGIIERIPGTNNFVYKG